MQQLNARIADIPLPRYMRRLPISPTGFPCPWFVAWFDAAGQPCDSGTGTPDFRVIGRGKVKAAHSRQLCWICGQPRGVNVVFVIGPMCAINRISAEPPAHLDCALYAVKACPFLSQPRMVRNEKNLDVIEHVETTGMIKRNPGVTLVWVTRRYQLTPVESGVIFQIGDPIMVSWWREGRTASRNEVLASIEDGMPALREKLQEDGQLDTLPRLMVRAAPLLPTW